MDNKKNLRMTTAGKILSEVLNELIALTKPGITEIEIDALAQKLILKKGGKPGFQRVPGYRHTICVSTNNVVVHGIPSKRVLKEGDIIGIDCGVFYEGYHTDMAETILVSTIDKKRLTIDKNLEKFLETGKRALFVGIREARPGNKVGHISKAIQETVEEAGYSVVRSLVGHGVGKSLHEEPEVPGYLAGGKIQNTPPLKPGMTIAVEVIYNMGKPEVVYDRNDDWTISTEDGSLSGLFERTILITETGPKLLTKLSGDRVK